MTDTTASEVLERFLRDASHTTPSPLEEDAVHGKGELELREYTPNFSSGFVSQDPFSAMEI
jgi:hypothetical protein